jgi:hypothetical protein
MLRLIAAEPAWPAIHFPTMLFALAILIGLTALSDSMPPNATGSLARMGRTVAHAAVPVMLVGVAIDGFAFKALADAWASASLEERAILLHAADAVVLAETGILHAWVSIFLGITFILFGTAMALGSEYPRRVGWLGIAGGIGCFLSGAVGFLQLPFVLPFPAFGILILAWLFITGILMARKAHRNTATAEPAAAALVPVSPGDS